MCAICEAKVSQRTFGKVVGMEPVVPVAPILTDLVDCEDCSEQVERGDCAEDMYGKFWSDESNVTSCNDCGGTVSCDEADDNDGYCEKCRRDNYVECHNCSHIVSVDDRVSNEDGDDYCSRCYSETYTSCEGCGCELCQEGRRTNGVWCESCYQSESDDDDGEVSSRRFSGGEVYDELRSKRKFGVELETSESDGWRDVATSTGWGAKEDGSVSGKEFVSAVLYGDDGLNSVRRLCGQAERAGFSVDNACGYHLHCDLTNTTDAQRKAIALAYAYTEKFWFSLVKPRRRNNTYCRPLDTDVATIKLGNSHPRSYDRYKWINWQAYDCHSTVEVRLHHGTINGVEVSNWIKAHLRFIDAVMNMSPGKITRLFGNKTVEGVMRNMRDIWNDTVLADYYVGKVSDYKD